jgi:hypothetical protein
MNTATQNPPVATGDGTGTPSRELPRVGDKIKAIKCRYHDTHNGLTGVVTQVIPGDPLGIICDLTTLGSNVTTGVAVEEWEIIVDPPLWPTGATSEELKEIIRRFHTDLQEEKTRSEWRLSEIQNASRRLTEQQGVYRTDMNHWESTLRQAKEDQDWCDEGTNRVIDRLNNGFIGGWEITPYRAREQRTIRIEGTVYRDVTVWVDPDDDEDDPGNWYCERDGEYALGEDWVGDQLEEEFQNNGWDDINYR